MKQIIIDESGWAHTTTLRKKKAFSWRINDTCDIRVRRFFKNEGKLRETTIPHGVIDGLLRYLSAQAWFPLANNVVKLKNDTEVDGIGRYLYKREGFSLTEAQLASHIAALFCRANLWDINKERKSMSFRSIIKETEWRRPLKEHYRRSLSNDTA